MAKVVYNERYGGFGLSPEAMVMLWEKKNPGKPLYFYTDEDPEDFTNDYLQKISKEDAFTLYRNVEADIYIVGIDFGDRVNMLDREFNRVYGDMEFYTSRHDPDLVEVVETLGEKAWGEFAELRIAEIDSNLYRIDDYDGMECVCTPESDKLLYIDINEH